MRNAFSIYVMIGLLNFWGGISGAQAGTSDYEPDDSSSQASYMDIGNVQEHHSIDPVGDQDWVRFQVSNVPQTITLATNGPDANSDTELFLYDADLTQLAYDDDNGPNYYSIINYTFNQPGTYYLRLRSYHDGSTIDDYEIGIGLGPTPTPTRTFTPTLTYTITPTATITPTYTQSPVVSITPTSTISPTYTQSPVVSITPTSTITPTRTATPVRSATPLRGNWKGSVISFPNPARNRVRIVWQEPGVTAATLRIFNTSGVRIAELRVVQPGNTMVWNTQAVAAGIYLYELELETSSQRVITQHKLAVVK